jgi:hypothetical protein
VLTKSNFGHVLEESIWGLCAALLIASLVVVWPRCRREVRPMLAAACAIGLGYVIYMFEVDVPMYWARWMSDLDQGRQFLSITQGWVEASGHWVVSHSWSDWKTEVIWMSLYFSVAVWISIGLIHVPSSFGPRNSLMTIKVAANRSDDGAALRGDTLRS